MNAPLQLTMGILAAHRNQYLFSDHYLDCLLRDDPRWSTALAEAGGWIAWLQALYAREEKQLRHYNESQLEERWFKPIWTQLGHVFEGQASVPGLGTGVKRPDYIFFFRRRRSPSRGGPAKQAGLCGQRPGRGRGQALGRPLGQEAKGAGPIWGLGT
jgi:hypothetical protein